MTSPIEPSWSIISIKSCPGNSVQLCASSNITLETVLTCDLEIETISTGNSKKKARKLTLYGVPRFLVEAFDWLEKRNGFTVEGIFRKDGSANRIRNPWQLFCGLSHIPDDYTIHDVCTLIKRFFGALRTPILAEQQCQIVSYVGTLTHQKTQVEVLLSFLNLLPVQNQATLGFLMRFLKKISEHSAQNLMSIENLAIVFVPAIFSADMREVRSANSFSKWGINRSDGSRIVSRSLQSLTNNCKKKTNSQESLRSEIDFVKRRESLQASVLALMINLSNYICDPRKMQVPIPRSVLHRKSSDLNVASQKPVQFNEAHQHPQATPVQERRGRVTNRADKIWPKRRSASENPFGRTKLLFSIPFGKNGSFAPMENVQQHSVEGGTPKVQQCRPPIVTQSPPYEDLMEQPAEVKFISPNSQNGSPSSSASAMKKMPPNFDAYSTPKQSRKSSAAAAITNTITRLFS